MTETSAIVTEYRLHPLDVTEEMPDAYLWDIVVQRYARKSDRWVVKSPLFRWMNAEGEWDIGHGPREVDDVEVWEDTHTFPLDKALELAEHGQWTLRMGGQGGKTAAEMLNGS
jgi:hypothetical protein